MSRRFDPLAPRPCTAELRARSGWSHSFKTPEGNAQPMSKRPQRDGAHHEPGKNECDPVKPGSVGIHEPAASPVRTMKQTRLCLSGKDRADLDSGGPGPETPGPFALVVFLQSNECVDYNDSALPSMCYTPLVHDDAKFLFGIVFFPPGLTPAAMKDW